MKCLCVLVPVLVAFCAPAAAEQKFDLPIDCQLGETCFIQQYMDHDGGGGARDFMCRTLTYDGHKGTDIRVPDLGAMQRGVGVLAAAAGTVIGVRNDMPDVVQGDIPSDDISGRECGNGAVLDHGNGWQTQYCHMKQGTLQVRPGQVVARGDTLGQVGLSGLTQFPHVHFQVKKDGQLVDPFAPSGIGECGVQPANSQWHDAIPYQGGGILTLGFADKVPAFDAVKAGTASAAKMHTASPALVLWAYGFGKSAGDTMELSIFGPDGEIHRATKQFSRTQAEYFQASGRRKPKGGWPVGTYRGEVTLRRDGEVFERRSIDLELRD